MNKDKFFHYFYNNILIIFRFVVQFCFFFELREIGTVWVFVNFIPVSVFSVLFRPGFRA